MPAKVEPVPAPAAAEKAAAATAAGAAPAAEASPAPGRLKAILFAAAPILLAAVLAAAASYAVVEYLMIPRLQKKLAEPPAAAPAAVAESGKEGAHGQTPAAPPSYEFTNVVVNLAGTMGTRYLKTSFVVTGTDPQIHSLFEAQKPRLTDVTIGVLSALTLADLEEPGSKNILREKLVAAYNQTFGHKVAEQVYFSDFVVQ